MFSQYIVGTQHSQDIRKLCVYWYMLLKKQAFPKWGSIDAERTFVGFYRNVSI